MKSNKIFVIFHSAGLLASLAIACTRPLMPMADGPLFVPPNGTPHVNEPMPAQTQSKNPGSNPLKTAPSATPTAPACLLAGGEMREHSLRTDLLPLPLEYRVYTPPCYGENPTQRYPVLYLIHGQSFTDDQWDRIGADEMAGQLIAAGEVAPFLIVMPRDRVWTAPDEDMFGRALVEDIIPWIDANYRTLSERQFRAIGGLSRGASWAVHLGLKYWELFGAIGGHSLPVFPTDIGRAPRWLDAIPSDSYPRIFVDVGTRDADNIVESSTWFENLLTEKGIPHEWYLFTGFHDEAYWSSHLEQYLRFYAAEW